MSVPWSPDTLFVDCGVWAWAWSTGLRREQWRGTMDGSGNTSSSLRMADPMGAYGGEFSANRAAVLMNRHFLMDLVDCWYLQGRALKVEDEFRRGVYLHAVE